MNEGYIAIATFVGNSIRDKHTHYEVPVALPESATLIIRGDIAQEFHKTYHLPITSAKEVKVQTEFNPNNGRFQFKPKQHLIGTIESLKDITKVVL